MALDFGKLEFSVSFNPTSAFPLDARSYFESLASAQAAAASATEVGKADSAYYVGQTLVVVENGTATFYMIQPNKTLVAIGEKIKVNTKLFEYDTNGNLSLKGFDEAAINSVLSKNVDGTLSWKIPVDAYSKAETDAKIDAAVAAAAHLKRKIVDRVEDINVNADDAEHYIYMVPTGLQEDSDKYDEYIVVVLSDDIRFVEKVGSWEVDLSDYAKQSEVETSLATKVDKEEGSRLITAAEINKLLGIETGAQVNYIKSTTADFLVQDGELQLQDLNISKVTGLQDTLTQIEEWLLTPTEREKLSKLVINGDNNLEISGTVNAENVKNLAEWITAHASSLKGLSEENFTTDLKTKLENAILITSVKKDELAVNSGELSIVEVDISKITGLQSALNKKANQSEVNTLSTTVQTLADNLNKYVLQTQYDRDIAEINSNITNLWDVLTWKEIQ